MDTSMTTIIVGLLIPFILIVASVYWTMKINYSKRFTPIIMLVLLAILVFLVPAILASFGIIGGGFGIAIISVYFSVSLVLGTLVNLIVVFTIKKKSL
ncbi:hypothetical protein [Bacillus suaedae]|uniref:YesK-like protein n=1 Tax=Halalkalibacter suaedae TaxID=2822140 RepID=A0A940WVE4_9BACI|nr:hypothetical protein [Bacillus suaedae]MBP3953120.1 hypothetical protein [Bacillus suaedae]